MFHLGTSTLTQLLATYGYLAVLLFVVIESTGIPFPGETMLLVLAVLLIIAGIVVVRRNEQRLEDEAERALPGPLGV